jgi:hypothetical protein
MSFFEPPESLPSPPEAHQPEWIGPPDNILGAAVPFRMMLARNDDVALAITEVTAYPTGVEFNLALRVRHLSPDAWRAMRHGAPFHLHRFPGDPPVEGIPPEILRLGVEFADGRRATTLDESHRRSRTDPAKPVLTHRGGGGGDRTWNMRFWLWPLPPSGPLAFVAEWPLGGIPLTRVEVDAELILQASLTAEMLWPEGGSSPGTGYTTQVVMASSDAAEPPNLP